MNWKTIDPRDWQENPIKLLEEDWCLISSGDQGNWNTMTASWGGIGRVWNLPMALIFVRPTRYTYDFIEKEKTFSLAFFDTPYRKILQDCGAKSGRDWNKMTETGLTSFAMKEGTVGFQEARTMVSCRVKGAMDMPESILEDPQLMERFYPSKNMHRLYFGEIQEVLTRIG